MLFSTHCEQGLKSSTTVVGFSLVVQQSSPVLLPIMVFLNSVCVTHYGQVCSVSKMLHKQQEMCFKNGNDETQECHAPISFFFFLAILELLCNVWDLG